MLQLIFGLDYFLNSRENLGRTSVRCIGTSGLFGEALRSY